MKSIKIYCDDGVDRKTARHLLRNLSSRNASFISAEQIREGKWKEETSLLIIPGGRDVPYHRELQGEGNRHILQFVEEGGNFLGICAGAYYGSSYVAFDLGGELEVAEDRELAFFPGTAFGPAYGPSTFTYNSTKGARATPLFFWQEGVTVELYYNGGCYFKDAKDYSDIDIIARYDDHPDTPAAMIEMQYGNGRVFLSGVHFEVGVREAPVDLSQKVKEQLSRSEEIREILFYSVIDSLC